MKGPMTALLWVATAPAFAQATPVEGGKKLDVRGSFGPFGRTQTWVRVQ